MSNLKNRIQFSRIRLAFRLAYRALAPYKAQIGILVLLGFVSSLLEGIGINALIPFISIVIGESSGGSDLISRIIQDFFALLGVDFSIKFILVFFVVLFVLKAVFLFLFNYVRAHIISDYEAKMRSTLFAQMVEARWEYLRGQKLGHLETVLMTNVRFASDLFERMGELVIISSGLLVYTVIALNISSDITGLTLLLGGFVFFLLQPLLSRTRFAAAETAMVTKDTAHYVNESVTGMKAIKASFVSGAVLERATVLFNTLKRLRIRVLILRGISSSILQPISLVFVSVVFAISYKLPDFNFAVLVAIVYLIQRLFSYIQQLQGTFLRLSEAAPYLKNILEYEDEMDAFRESPRGSSTFSFENSVSFDAVSFSYGKDLRTLRELSFTIPKGHFVGLVGVSGSGKTTVTDLLLRLYTPTSGAITVDGVNIEDIRLDEWRGHIAYVSQDMFLMNDTVANNIRFYDASISDAEIVEAAKRAGIYEFIRSCPQGLDTVVGERGTRLSGGQRQRITIARALVRKPALLILDEATSALDSESEDQIKGAIEELRGTVTVFVIAHRLTTVLDADSVVVLDQGAKVEEGDPQALLMNPSSEFHKLYRSHV